jgi:predicted anti-sigma-YlaC factor YlaD
VIASFICRRLRPTLVDLAQGTLAGEPRRELDAHLAACVTCRADLEAMRNVSAALRDADDDEPSEAFWHDQRTAIMRRVRDVPAPARSPRLRLAVALAAAMLAAVLVRTRLVSLGPTIPHAVERLDEEALFHLDDLLPALVPAVTIDDADGDLLGVHELGHEELDALNTLVDEIS